MKSIVKEFLTLNEKNLSESEIADFLSDIETALLKIRFKHKKFNLEYNIEEFEGRTSNSLILYILPLWCFIRYSKKEFDSVIDLINKFVSYDFGFLKEIDFQRTSSGALRAFTNLRFAGAKLKKAKILSEEKGDDWTAYKLTDYGKKEWENIENYFTNGTANALKNKLLNDLVKRDDYKFEVFRDVILSIKHQLNK